METLNFLLVGVGGQGILTASDILSQVGLQAGYDVKKSEVHGMSQRGGAVSSHVRFAPRVYAPLIAEGEVDYLLAFEMIEALRWIHFLRPAGTVLVNRQAMPPVAVASGKARYPDEEEIRRELDPRAGKVLIIDALRVAQELQNLRVANIVILGALSAQLPTFSSSLWEQVIRERVPARFVDLNLRAFELGRQQAEKG